MEPSIANQAVVFTTQTPYPLPSQKYMIPTIWRRYHLSQLVNKALGLTKPIPFDFLVKGEILRTTIAEWCAEKGVGEEETLEIEYIESVLPPQRLSEFPHESWVSGVSCRLPSHFLTTSYDGHLRAHDLSKNVTLDAQIHSAPITSLSIISSSDNETHTIATSSHDHTGAITHISLDPMSSTTAKATTLATLHLHTAPLSSIASNTSGTHLLTASWDGLIGLWDASIPPSHEVPDSSTSALTEGRSKKRRKVTTDDEPTSTTTSESKRKAPLNVLKSHLSRVSKAAWVDASTNAVSCGFDSTVRTWDVEVGVCTRTISCSEKPFLDLAVANRGQTVLGVSTDRTMVMFDLREGAEGGGGVQAAAASFVHPTTPSCVVVPPQDGQGSGQQVVTGGYDGVVRVWDVRSTKSAISTFKAWDGTKKVLSVDWARGIVGVGGEGGLDVWKVGVEASSQSDQSEGPA